MKTILFVIVILSLFAMANGPSVTMPPPPPPPPPPPVETQPPPPPEKPTEPSEPPGHGVTPESPGKSKPGGKAEPERVIMLPSGGYGPQEQGTSAKALATLVGSICFFGGVLVFVALALGIILERKTKDLDGAYYPDDFDRKDHR